MPRCAEEVPLLPPLPLPSEPVRERAVLVLVLLRAVLVLVLVRAVLVLVLEPSIQYSNQLL